MKLYFPVLISFLLLSNLSCSQIKETSINRKTIQFTSLDNLPITADLYMTNELDAPLIILFHQARFSRGEYLEIAPKLNKLGFNCLAIDQRSGKEVNDVVNQTHIEAVNKNLNTKYKDAIPDLEAAYFYAKDELHSKSIIIWGSSYSSSLVLYLGSKYSDKLKGIVCFSPDEYFTIDDSKIKTFASKITCPVFITSAKNEQEYWQEIYNAIPSNKAYFVPEGKGNHGSKALWKENEGNEEYWQAVTVFLQKLKG